MFASLLAVTLVLSLAVSAGTARAFTEPIERILTRIVAEDLAPGWLRNLRFALVAYVIVRFAETRKATGNPE